MVSVTPIHLDTTYHAMLEHFKAWEQPLSKPAVTRHVVTARSPRRSRA